jgi:hypothetical protein
VILNQAGKSDCVSDSSSDMLGSTDSRWFDGNIDEVRIYDYARTPAQIAWDYNRGKPINEWRFDEGAGTVVHDQGPNRNNGTITGAVWKSGNECNKGSAQGSAEEKCLYFDGEDLTLIKADTIDNMKTFSACAWVKPRSFLNSGSDESVMIFEKGWHLSVFNSGIVRFRIPSSNTYPTFDSSESLVVNQWQRVCGVYYGFDFVPKIFVNGKELEGTGYAGFGSQNNDSGNLLGIGGQAFNEYYGSFYGYIDDPKIYNYALTAEQIKLDYNGGAVGFR